LESDHHADDGHHHHPDPEADVEPERLADRRASLGHVTTLQIGAIFHSSLILVVAEFTLPEFLPQ
jgi:hypothetical protein